MAKRILLIESDGAVAQEMSEAIEARGLEARVTTDGKEGLELARMDRPDLIVLSVELPRMSGYSVCNKLKKDDELRSIPLVIISAEATPETFDQHRKLKTHADDYLIKPFAPAELLKKIAGLVELPAEPVEDEVVTLEDVEELELLGSGPGALGEESTPAALAAAAEAEDEDLKLLDDAFDSLANDDATGMTAIDGAEPASANRAVTMPAPPPPPPPAPEPELELAPAPEVERLGDEADAALAALGGEVPPELDLADAAGLLDDGPTPSGDDLLRRAGIEMSRSAAAASDAREEAALRSAEAAEARAREAALEQELATVRAALEEQRELLGAASAARLAAEEQARASAAEARESVLLEEAARRTAEERAAQAEERAAEAEERARAAAGRAEAAEQQASQLRGEAEASRREAARSDGEAAQARERAEELARELQVVQARAGEHESALAALQPELESLRAGLAEAQDAAASSRVEAERVLAEREQRLGELEAQNAKHEERVVKAYQKIKGDEKMREKARKALTIALQLLEDRPAGAPASSAGEVQPRRE